MIFSQTPCSFLFFLTHLPISMNVESEFANYATPDFHDDTGRTSFETPDSNIEHAARTCHNFNSDSSANCESLPISRRSQLCTSTFVPRKLFQNYAPMTQELPDVVSSCTSLGSPFRFQVSSPKLTSERRVVLLHIPRN